MADWTTFLDFIAVYSALGLIICLVSLFLLYRFKGRYPLKGRALGLLVIFLITGFGRFVSIFISVQVQIGCFSRLFSENMSANAMTLIFCIRAIRLFWKFRQEHEKISIHSQWVANRSAEKKDSKEHVPLIKTPFYIKYDFTNPKAIYFTLFLGMILLFGLSYYNAGNHDEWCNLTLAADIYWICISLIVAIILGVSLLLMRKFHDMLYVYQELLLCLIMLIVITVIAKFPLHVFVVISLWLSLSFTWVLIVGILPFIRAYQHYKKKIDPTENDSLTLQLSTPKGHEAFKDHLVREFAVENLMFYDAVIEFERDFIQMNEEERRRSAFQIFNVYVNKNVALLEINIPSDIFTNVCERLGVEIDSSARTETWSRNSPSRRDKDYVLEMNICANVERDVFTDARTHIFQLMESSSFPNYLLDAVRANDMERV